MFITSNEVYFMLFLRVFFLISFTSNIQGLIQRDHNCIFILFQCDKYMGIDFYPFT